MNVRSALLSSLLLLGCAPADSGQGHGHDHGAGEGADHHAEDEGESIAITRWTDTHELFVELDAPVAGQAFAYHAHVTRLADNHAATEGSLTLRFLQDGFAVESHTDPAIARAGIFAADAPAPPAGEYILEVAYENGDERSTWNGGTVDVGASEAVPHPEPPGGEVSFLKEAQWQIPFRVERAALRPLAGIHHATATAIPDPRDVAVVAAPATGLVLWTDGLPAVGRRVKRSERLATLVPAGAAEHWSRIQADIATARIDLDLAQQEVSRVSGLVDQALLPGKRLAEAQAARQRAEAELRAAEQRSSALTSGSSGAVPIRAPADGLVTSAGARHGQRVEAGAPLVSVAATDQLVLDGHLHDRPTEALSPVQSVSVHRGDWAGPRDLLAAGGQLLTDQLVYDPATLSAPLLLSAPASLGLRSGDLVSLELGVGAATPRVAVPRSAIVEVSGRSVLFVQLGGESFTRRRVTLGARNATHVELLDGVEAGEYVVTEGGFDVHVASLTGALESHRH